MAQYVYTMNRVSKTVPPKRQILKDISLSFFPGAKIGVLGLNGSGKSSLLKIMAGVDKEIEGEAMPMPGLSIGYLEQEPKLDPEHTVRQAVEEAMGEVNAAKARLEEIYAAYAEEGADFDALAAEQGELEAVIAAAGTDSEHQIEIAADALRLPAWDAKIGLLSGGEKRRVALCKLLLSKPDMLLLDEPTNHLDAESVEWLEVFLQRFTGTVVAITHDRYFLDNAAEWILELDRGRGIPWKGNYSTWLEQKGERLAQEQKSEEAHAKALKKELEWSRQNPKARQAKNKARLGRYEEMVAEAEKTRKLDFEEIQIPTPPRLGNVVVEVDNLKKGFDDRVLIENLSFTLPRNGIVGVIGPNGVGKSTLFKTIVGLEQPDAGTVKVGETVKLSYVDQSRAGIDPKKTVWEVVSDKLDYIEVGQNEIPSRAYVSAFGFKGPDQQKPAGVLSGGERNRLNLALTLKEGGNLILLDEPTNDLDVETLSSLENALEQFPGCAVVISHDRWFLDRTCTHILAWEGDDEDEAKWFWFEGNFGAYEENKVERLGIEAARPHRVTHRKLTRD